MRRSRSILATSTSVMSTCWCGTASTPTGPTSSGRLFATNSTGTPTQSVARKTLDLGLLHYSRVDLEAALERGEALRISVLGLASIASDVTPELARAAIASVTVLGALHASPEVRAALADRTG